MVAVMVRVGTQAFQLPTLSQAPPPAAPVQVVLVGTDTLTMVPPLEHLPGAVTVTWYTEFWVGVTTSVLDEPRVVGMPLPLSTLQEKVLAMLPVTVMSSTAQLKPELEL